MPNRLAAETSPYLQQHAHNPVDWYPWGPEALERSRAEQKPILLSIGYSACHWCHVMAHESFEDEGIAALMNREYINVKVDREERPDLDQIYQSAHQMLAERAGGWPLTAFLAPDGTPFFSGTYFPRTPKYGMPGFGELLQHVAAIWREKRKEIGEQSEQVRAAFASTLPKGAAHRSSFDDTPLAGLLDQLKESFDPQWGGFGAAPKFPHSPDLEFCLRAFALRGEVRGREMAHVTLLRMCEGGVYDHLGGGFCRYSTDERWMIPHFEKMLYDNGPLLGLLADAWIVTGEDRFARCAQDTARWLEREMQAPEGGYYSSLDADSEHAEGKFYVWDREEVRTLLLEDEYKVGSLYYGLDQPPNFEGRHWHLHVARGLGECAQLAGISKDDAERLLTSARAKLFAARAERVRPGRDEKVLVSWNALVIRGMARAGRVFDKPEWIASARRALAFITANMLREGRLLATYKDGRAHLNAYLDDYAFLLAALTELLQAEYRSEDLALAEELADVLLEQFEDPAGGFFFTSRDHERLLHRPKPGHDNATPSGNGVTAWALNRLAAITGVDRYARAAERTLELYFPALRAGSAGYASLAIALEELLAPPAVLILRGEAKALAGAKRSFAREFLPDTVILALPAGVKDLPAVLDKPAHEVVTGWLCRGATCLEPSQDLQALKQALKLACKDIPVR